MEAVALKPIRVKTTGKEYRPGDRVDAEPGKLLQWCERGLVRIVDENMAGEVVHFNSPLFGHLEAPILSQDFDSFTLTHPLTGEVVRLPNEWLVSLEERSAILEHDGGFSQKEADDRAAAEFLRLFGKWEHSEKA